MHGGVADELMQQSNYRFNTIGYVKPNAKLSDLLNTAKSELGKLTKTDTIITRMIGGSNDFDENSHGNNLTSIWHFLEGTQNTNVILSGVPVRYDIAARTLTNEQIARYNKKLHKVTKSFTHVKLVKVTTNRDDFTKHGLHLNNKGKEKLSTELLKNLSASQKTQKTVPIYLPWKSETTGIGTLTARSARPDEVLNTSTGVEYSKETSTQFAQRNPKLQRRCPKVKSDDFLWN